MQEAVAAILVCKSEIFVIRRQENLRAFPGYYAFPGGKVDAEDRDRSYSHPLLASLPGHLAGALVRELHEELDFDLEQAVGQGAVMAVDHFGEAITPPFAAQRFNAHFLRIDLEERPIFRADVREIAWAGWLDHRELYRRYTTGEALMAVPVMNAVRALAEAIGATHTDPFNLVYDAERELPCLEAIRGVGLIPVPSQTLPPAKNTNCLLLGDAGAPRLLVDPSPRTGEGYRKLLRTLEGRRPEVLFISHHHPDHHEQAPRLAREWGVPLCCSARTLEDLRAFYPAQELAGVAFATAAPGQELTLWLGEPVRCYALPGHDEGMLGLAPDNLAWFFVADLVQTGASIVIPEHGGDMASYFASLRRVIELAPRVLIPSHGLPAGGVHLAVRTLAHRQRREAQINRCREAGLDADAIVAQLYPHLEPRLRRLALQNVREHLKKLAAEDPS
jgi:endoribonuclease LACTB2